MSEAVSIQSLAKVNQEAVPENNPVPGAVIAMQTFGDLIACEETEIVEKNGGFPYTMP